MATLLLVHADVSRLFYELVRRAVRDFSCHGKAEAV